MKKKIALLLVLCMALASLAACADTSTSKKSSKSKSSKTKKTEYVDVDDTDPTDETDDIDDTHATYEPTETTETTVATTTEQIVNVKPNANATVKWVDYKSPDGFFTITIPEDWKIAYNNIDTIGYEILVADPNEQKVFYFCTSVVGFPSKDNFNYWKKAAKKYGLTIGSKGYISPKATAQSLFENSGHYFEYTNFKLMGKLGDNGYGGDVLQATCDFRGKQSEGLFTSSLVNLKMPYKKMDWDLVSGTTMLLTPVEDFTDWINVLVKIYASLNFTDSYYKARNAVWKQVYGTAKALSYNADQMSAMLMDSWEKSNRSSDISSQAYSDATLGRERVYDTETGDVYYATNGWSDTYTGTRYKPVESGSDYYLKPVTGTIY